MIDDRLNFNTQVDYACEKAAKAIYVLGRIIPNNAGPSSSKRRPLASVSSSIVMYGGPVWVAALKTQRNRVKLSNTFRFVAKWSASTYRTISPEEVCVIAGMIPISFILV
ncbi:uncharacterized protein LOC131676090 [Topomyia yanbarensis]|uniref:uncharacterized protein LOC131676090 n=1 Tax=Topomyia yanbarensis TaxID=2498891 RepID=UPI00273ACB39|nr:uncharacterized protein LOC131676090 [Topomyia yanbarensis]